jgi:hypothetical protein
MLGMAMACEEIQSTTETVGTGNETVFGCNQQSARSANDCIDQYFAMMCSLFHMKYKSFTPMMKPDSEDVLRQVGPHAIPIIKKIKALCEEKCMVYRSELALWTIANLNIDRPFLDERRYAPVGRETLAKYYARQVARFLLGFWNPEGQ